MTRAYVFPGQGSQFVGMGHELAEAIPTARHLFQEVDEALKQNLSRLMFEGPEEDLVLTENAQPALMALSLAVVRVLEVDGGVKMTEACAYVAGHSLGEYSALAAARALSLEDTARLLKRRGLAMQRAVPVGEGAMVALFGVSLEDARGIAAEAAQGEVCVAANDNSPEQVVLSGAATAVERAVELAGKRGAKRAILLQVSAPFHSPLMTPAAEEMAAALGETEITTPIVPLVTNVTAAAVTQPEDIRRCLVEQICVMVRWRESILYLRDHDVDRLVELGAGKVLTGLARRIDRDLDAVALQTPEDIEAFCKDL
jgi:[acyl-carrier-protein] S-malonyltransferase